MPKRHHHKLSTVQSEPALVRGVVVAVLGLLTSLGIGWASHVDATLATAVVVAVLALGQAVWTHRAVTPNAKVVTRVTTAGEVVAGDAAIAETGSPVNVIADGRSAPIVAPTPVKPSLIRPAQPQPRLPDPGR